MYMSVIYKLWPREESSNHNICQPKTPQFILNERRKYEVLKYRKNNAGFTKAQNFSNVAKGLRRIPTTEVGCESFNLPTASGVPGRSWNLLVDKDLRTAPLTNYRTQRTYSSSGMSWPIGANPGYKKPFIE